MLAYLAYSLAPNETVLIIEVRDLMIACSFKMKTTFVFLCFVKGKHFPSDTLVSPLENLLLILLILILFLVYVFRLSAMGQMTHF